MSLGVTLRELVESIPALAGVTLSDDLRREREELTKRRIRHWTLAGILPTMAERHGGTGRHRRYNPKTAYIVTILNELADAGLPIGVLRTVALTIPDGGYDKENLWQDAISGTKQVFLFISPWVVDCEDMPGILLVLVRETGLVEMAKKRTFGIYVNLTNTFRGVKA